jgi:NitT/TauT family transport system ATP-binding protein
MGARMNILSESGLVRTKAGASRPALAVRIKAKNLEISFETEDGKFVAVRDVAFDIPPGEFAAIVGPSGCGKSTVLNAISGLITPSAGFVYLNDQRVESIRSEVGYLFQKDALLPWQTVLQNMMLPLIFRKVPRRETMERAHYWLRRVNLAGQEHKFPHQLSGGMKKRVALATVFIYSPPVLLMDEPFSALDVQTRQLMETELLDLWDEYKPTVLFVTHDLEEAVGLADRVLVFTAGPGRVKQSYQILLSRPRSLTEVRFTPEFRDLHERIWLDLREEVLTTYEKQMGRTSNRRSG